VAPDADIEDPAATDKTDKGLPMTKRDRQLIQARKTYDACAARFATAEAEFNQAMGALCVAAVRYADALALPKLTKGSR
jgi:hypothetical protein